MKLSLQYTTTHPRVIYQKLLYKALTTSKGHYPTAKYLVSINVQGELIEFASSAY